MASYQTPYDKDSYISKGYDLPKEAIMGAIAARTQYFEQGLSKIKNQYENTFDFNLTSEENKANLRAQKDQADQTLKGLIKTDLSIGDNVSSALKVFDPIVKNENFIFDDHYTKSINGEIQKASTEMLKKGADHFNMLSVQVLKDKLDDLRLKKSDPNTGKIDFSDFSNDALGTTYQPADPEGEQKWIKEGKDFAKSKVIKKQTPVYDPATGAYRLQTVETSAVDDFEMSRFLKESAPQSVKINNELEARLEQKQSLKIAQENPQGAAQVQTIYKQQVDNLIKENVSYANKQIATLEAEKGLQPRDDKETISLFDNKITEWKKFRDTDIPANYGNFDYSAFTDPNKKQKAIAQINAINADKKFKELSAGMGLDAQTVTYTQDAAAISAANLRYNKAKDQNALKLKQFELYQKAGGKLKFDDQGNIIGVNGTQGDSPSSTLQSTEVTDPQDQTELAKQTIAQIKGNLPQQQQEILPKLFAESGFLTNVNGENLDIFSAINKLIETNPNANVSTLIDRMPNEDRKNILVKLLNGAFVDQPVEGAWKNKSLEEVRYTLQGIFTDRETTKKIFKKVGVDDDKFALMSGFGTEMELQKANNNIIWDKYEDKFIKSYQDAGIKIPKEYAGSALAQFNEDGYVASITPELRKKGFNEQDIRDFTSALKENKDISTKLVYEHGIPHLVNNGLNPKLSNLVNYQKAWNDSQNNLLNNVAATPTKTTNANYAFRTVFTDTEGAKIFNPENDIRIGDIQKHLSSGTSFTINGQSPDDAMTGAMKEVLKGGLTAASVQSVTFHRTPDGKPYIKIIPNINGMKSVIKDIEFPDTRFGPGGTKDKDEFIQQLPDLKIFVNENFASQYLAPKTSSTTTALANSNIGIPVPLNSINENGEQNKAVIYNGGVGKNIVPRLKASFKLLLSDHNGRFSISNENVDAGPNQSLGNLTLATGDGRNTGLTMSGVTADYEKALKEIRYRDDIAGRIEEVLHNNKEAIPKTGFINFKSLKPETQEQLKKEFPNEF